MDWITTLPVAALLFFTMYLVTTIRVFGIFPPSLSETYYYWDFVKKGLGIVFTIMMFVCAFCLMPAWIEITEALNPNFTFLPFLSCVSICFVGAAPAFKSDPLERKVHTYSAIWAAFCALLWCFVVCYDIWYVTVGVIVVTVCLGYWLDKADFKNNVTFWLEMCAFFPTFIVTIIKSFMLQ